MPFPINLTITHPITIVIAQADQQELLAIVKDTASTLRAFIAASAANQEKTRMFEDDVITKLNSQKTVNDGVVTLLSTLTTLIKANPGTDPAKQAQILKLIDDNSQEVADAIVANTPAAGGPPPTP